MIQRKDSIVFSPGHIGNIELKNRLVRSATYDNAATPEGRVTEKMIEIYRTLAKGGIGLIITGIVGIYKKAITPHLILGNYDDSFLPELKKISQAVHDSDGECKIMVQLHHPGRQVIHPEDLMKILPYLPKVYMSYIEQHPEALQSQDQPTKLVEPTAPSPVFDNLFDRTPRGLEIKEINEIIDYPPRLYFITPSGCKSHMESFVIDLSFDPRECHAMIGSDDDQRLVQYSLILKYCKAFTNHFIMIFYFHSIIGNISSHQVDIREKALNVYLGRINAFE